MKILIAMLALIAADSEYSEYRSWKPTTAEPFFLLDAVFCRPATPGDGASGPHDRRFIRVYVNAKGHESLETTKAFPVGTVIVKEKLLTKSDDKVHELGIMIKRETGWDYQFVGSDGKLFQGKDVKNCVTCHGHAKHDSVFSTLKPK